MTVTTIRTSHVTLAIDYEWALKEFSFSIVNYEDYKVKQPYKILPVQLYGLTPACVYAITQIPGQKSFLVLHKKDSIINLKNPSLRIKPIATDDGLKNLGELQVGRVLIKALPRYLKEKNAVAEEGEARFDADGLYYEAHYGSKSKNSQHPVVVAVEIDIREDKTLKNNEMYLSLGVQTFRPIDSFDVVRPHDKNILENTTARYQLGSFGMVKSVKGEYLKKGFGKLHKNRVDLVDVDSYKKYVGTKISVLNRFHRDFRKAYGENICINEKVVNSSQYIAKTNAQTTKEYAYLWEVFSSILKKKGGLCIVNMSKNQSPALATNIKKTIRGLLGEDIDLINEQSAGETTPTLLLINEEQYYETTLTDDPYLSFREKNPRHVVQAITIEKLCEEKSVDGLNHHVIEVSLKELLLKMEVADACQYINGPVKDSNLYTFDPDALYVFPYSVNVNEDNVDTTEIEWRYAALQLNGSTVEYQLLGSQANIMHTNEQLYDAMQNRRIENYIGSRDTNNICYPFIYWKNNDRIVTFVNTGACALPDFEEIDKRMRDKNAVEKSGISRELLEDFCKKYKSSHENVTTALLTLLKEEKQSTFTVKELRDKAKIADKGNQNQFFYDWLAEPTQLGAHPTGRIRSKQNGVGLLDSTLGFFFNEEERVYYAAGSGAAESSICNFSKIYRIIDSHAALAVDSKVLSLFHATHVRHKQHAVYPLPFKHLKEYLNTKYLYA